LETELPRFAEPLGKPGSNGRRQYRLTPESLTAGRSSGLSLTSLETWFQQRAGLPLSPAARLLLNAVHLPPPELKQHLVLHVATVELADGLLQWPATRALIEGRLGPTTLTVLPENAQKLQDQLRILGISDSPKTPRP
jgi:hypothetical protein